MQQTIKISCKISNTDQAVPLGLEIWLDDQQIYNQSQITGTQIFEHEMPDEEDEHELRFVMKNKQADHTTVDEAGHIVKDARLIISDLCLDQVALGHIFSEQAVYTHNFNGTAAETQQKFYGEMGCNGTVCLSFDTPIYLWLLEHM